ncbi:MAG: 50S ribosomal protein L25/general stress protein Ctc [Piscirickettsiaceae bacterium]|nr:MAG: 50S ribosomal protein L25/general stress protein Ctc [Piscirickettsiaceae bacterium]PCI70520.1 MAG: 50S ribosomal protein L25/general stress protein Ctc [Piscirickettsiaceae bacterium]
MSTDFELVATIREDLGKGATRRLRRQNKVPAIVYGAGKDPVSITLGHNELLHSTENEAFFSHIVTISVGKKKEKVIIKALQRHPSRSILMHADFMRVSMKETLKVNVPIHFIGEDVAPGVKAGGVVTHDLVDVEIQCLPADLPEFVEIDISALEIGSSLHLSDIQLAKGLEIVALLQDGDHNLQVVSVQNNRAAEVDEVDESEEIAAEDAENESEEGDSE